MNVKVCDRCGEKIVLDLTDKDFIEGDWRYKVIKDCYPYPESITIDLCLNCKRKLHIWLGGK